MTKSRITNFNISQILCMGFFLIVIVMFDFTYGFSIIGNLYFTAYAIITFLIVLFPFVKSYNQKLLIFPTIYLFILVFLATNYLSPAEPLLAAKNKFSLGMSPPEILKIINSEFSKSKFNKPILRDININMQQFILDPTNPNYDWHWLIVDYNNGKFIKAEISID